MHDGIDGEGGDTLHTELLHDVFAMGDDSGEADMQLVGNLLINITLYDERHDLYLSVGEDFLL